MKLWRLVSILRTEPEIIRNVCQNHSFKQVAELYERFNHHVKTQNREVLDAELPAEFCREAFYKSKLLFCLRGDGYLQLSDGGEDEPLRLSALDVYNRFGGDVIEEVLECGSVKCKPKTM